MANRAVALVMTTTICLVHLSAAVPQAIDSAVWLFRFGAAAIRRKTSGRLTTTGNFCATRTGCILDIKSMRPSVTSKKNFNSVIVALSVIGEVPRLTMCS